METRITKDGERETEKISRASGNNKTQHCVGLYSFQRTFMVIFSFGPHNNSVKQRKYSVQLYTFTNRMASGSLLVVLEYSEGPLLSTKDPEVFYES